MALPQRQPFSSDVQRLSGAQDWHALYKIANAADVEEYVAGHLSVVPILYEAPNEIRAVFGNEAPPTLEVEWDPEEGDCWLSVGIPTVDVGPSVLPMIYALEERWWLDRMTSTDATVVFDVVLA